MATRKTSKGKGRAKAASRKVVKLKSKATAAKKTNGNGHLPRPSSKAWGQAGNTVLAGHHNIKGEVFRDLWTLQAGDKIETTYPLLYDEWVTSGSPVSFLNVGLAAKHGLSAGELQAHREDIVRRFGNKALGDQVQHRQRLVNADQAEPLTAEVVHLAETKLGQRYSWPGNFRELEQCVRNVLVRGRYEPVGVKPRAPAEALAADLAAGRLTADQVLQRYCSIVYGQTHNLEETARRLNLDRRTVKAKLLAQVGSAAAG